MLFSLPPNLTWRSIEHRRRCAIIPIRSDLSKQAPRGFRRSDTQVIWVDVLILLIAALILAWNGSGVGIQPCAGPFAAALTAILFLSGWAFLQALNTLLRPHIDRLNSGATTRLSERGEKVGRGDASSKAC